MSPKQLPSLLDAAGRLRPIVATLACPGLRNGEVPALAWPDVNLASGAAAAALREELAEAQGAGARKQDGPVFPNHVSKRQTVSNVERRLKTANPAWPHRNRLR